MIQTIFELLFRSGLCDRIYTLRPQHLTVLAYHRVTDLPAAGFDTYRRNVSATPTGFAAQMDFICTRFNVISLQDLLLWLRGAGELPMRPALITFDDGYRDNFRNAFPVLRTRNLPAVIFLTTGYIGKSKPLWWDLVAFCFAHTQQQTVHIPLIGRQQWQNPASRNIVMDRLLQVLKGLPEDEKATVVEQLPRVLEVDIPADTFTDMFLTWEHIRMMVAQGIAMGAHTQNHPIMTRIPLEQARAEVRNSKASIEEKIGQPVTTFAYTNGLTGDFNREVQAMLRQELFEAAFTLLPGPVRLTQVRQSPLAIQRIAVSNKDTLSRLAVKLIRSV